MREKVRANALSSVRQAATQVVLQRGARVGHEARPDAEQGIPVTLTPADLFTKMTEAGKEDGKSPEHPWDSVSPLLTQAPTLTFTDERTAVDEAAAVATLSRWAVRRAARKKCPKSAVLPPAAELNAPNLSLQLQQMQEQIQQQMQQQKQQMQQMQQMQMQMQMRLNRWEVPPDDQHGGKSISPTTEDPQSISSTAEDPQVDMASTPAKFSGQNAANSDPQNESPDSIGRKVAVEQAKVFFLNSGDLPPDLAFHKDLSTIKQLFESQPDLTFSRWCRRGVYTERLQKPPPAQRPALCLSLVGLLRAQKMIH